MMVNGVCVVQGEASAVVALLKKFRRHSSHLPALDEHDPLLRNFADLRDVLNSITDLSEMNSKTFLSPFLDVIMSEATDGVVTSRALAAVDKFINYGLLNSNSIRMTSAVQSVAEAVTKAKFVGTSDTGSDECVLYQILQTLRSLLLFVGGRYLTDEMVCEVLQCCFRIGLESSLSSLLRMSAESVLTDMTRLLFTRLPTFEQDIRHPYIRKLVFCASAYPEKCSTDGLADGGSETGAPVAQPSDQERPQTFGRSPSSTTSQPQQSKQSLAADSRTASAPDLVNVPLLSPSSEPTAGDEAVEPPAVVETTLGSRSDSTDSSINELEMVVVEPVPPPPPKRLPKSGIPHGLPCVRELLRFLIALTNPHDDTNTNSMILMGLNLLTIALEAGADYFANYPLLMPLVKNELCKSLLQLLENDRLQIFTAVNRVCFLLFESLRTHLKFQLESYFLKLNVIITNEQIKTPYELKEIAMESLIVLWRIPGLVTELYLNYDCSLYCSNLFEDLTRLLLQNAFPLGGLRSTHILALDALLAVVETIERNCVMRQADILDSLTLEGFSLEEGAGGGHTYRQDKKTTVGGLESKPYVSPPLSSNNYSGAAGYAAVVEQQFPLAGDGAFRKCDGQVANSVSQSQPVSNIFIMNANQQASAEIPSVSEIIDCKKRKKLIAEATELFNLKPNKGVEFLVEKGILKPGDACAGLNVVPADVVMWLRRNPRLDKTKIAEYICSRSNSEILKAFVDSFEFEGLRLDEALRKFLETFRLPGEAAEISKLMTQFSNHWYASNHEPFGDADAAFTLSYAVIMLNMDQHNPQVRRLQPPMNFESFKKNLSGTNAGRDFEEDMLAKIFHAIKSEEIVMPAEQTGLVRENYLWKVLLRRGESSEEGFFLHAPVGWNDHDLFSIIWGSATAALSYVFDRSNDETILTKSLTGYRKCASIAAYYGMTNVFDNLIIHLCKFSTLMSTSDDTCGGLAENSDEPAHPTSSIVAGKSHSAAALEAMAVSFAEDRKAQMATKTMFHLVHKHGDNLREGWKNVLDCVLHLFKAHLLPAKLVEVEDYMDPKNVISIQRVHKKKTTQSRQETSIFSWLGFSSGSDLPSGRRTSIEQEQLIKQSKAIVADCHPEQLITDSKYLTSSALSELMSSIVFASQSIAASQSLSAIASGAAASTISGVSSNGFQSDDSMDAMSTGGCDETATEAGGPQLPAGDYPHSHHNRQHHHRLRLSAQREDSVIFLLEFMISIVLENRDIIMQLWPQVKSHLHFLLSSFDHNPLISERAIIGLLRVASRNFFRGADEIKITEEMLQSLVLLLQLKPPTSEEVGVRAVQLVSKIFLYHLMQLSRLPSFLSIVKQLLLFMESYMRNGGSELLAEAIPESLKNIVLVLDNSGLLAKDSDLYRLIARQLLHFRPELVAELMNNGDETSAEENRAPATES